MGRRMVDALRDRLAAGAAPHREPGRPAKALYSPLGASLGAEQGRVAKEYQGALACHLDATRALTLARTRLSNAERRLAGARKACTAAGIDVASLQQPKTEADSSGSKE